MFYHLLRTSALRTTSALTFTFIAHGSAAGGYRFAFLPRSITPSSHRTTHSTQPQTWRIRRAMSLSQPSKS